MLRRIIYNGYLACSKRSEFLQILHEFSRITEIDIFKKFSSSLRTYAAAPIRLQKKPQEQTNTPTTDIVQHDEGIEQDGSSDPITNLDDDGNECNYSCYKF